MELISAILSAILEKLSEHITIAGGELMADAAGNYLWAHPILLCIVLILAAIAGAAMLVRIVVRRLRR